MKKDRVKELLIAALQNAIDYEESKLDAGVDLGDKSAVLDMKRNIKAWGKMQDYIYPNRPMTLRQYLNTLPDDSFVSVAELMSNDSKGELK